MSNLRSWWQYTKNILRSEITTSQISTTLCNNSNLRSRSLTCFKKHLKIEVTWQTMIFRLLWLFCKRSVKLIWISLLSNSHTMQWRHSTRYIVRIHSIDAFLIISNFRFQWNCSSITYQIWSFERLSLLNWHSCFVSSQSLKWISTWWRRLHQRQRTRNFAAKK